MLRHQRGANAAHRGEWSAVRAEADPAAYRVATGPLIEEARMIVRFAIEMIARADHLAMSPHLAGFRDDTSQLRA